MQQPLTDIIKNLPKAPGVYRYYDKDGQLLYIGKAKNLKNRVSSYFVNKDHSYRIQLMVKKIHNIEYSIVHTERDALLLENALIKEFQPRYNISLRDDKTYPYIKLVNEKFPRLYFTRNYENDGAEYFGPYTSVHRVRAILELIKKLYPIRSCSLPLTEKNIEAKKFKVCLEYHIGNCLGPCVGLQSKENYDSNIEQIRKILKGRLQELRNILKKQMQQFADALEFEKAENIREKLELLKGYIADSTIVNPGLGNFHVFGFTDDEKKAYINYLYVYEGTVIKTKAITLQKNLDEAKEELMQFAIIDTIGTDTEKVEVLLPFDLDVENNLINISVPKIGDKKHIVELAQRNALFQKQKGKEKIKPDNTTRILELMKTELKLNELPVHIECFDNSNFQGTNAVAACVVFKNAKPSKKDYRHFNVKTVEGANDFDTMKEIVYRRYYRTVTEEQPLPNLIVIDGGKGQLSAAMEALASLQLQNKVQAISIAKRLEEIYYPNDPFPLHISKKSETLKVIQHIRNEAHRFGITFHRSKRARNTIKTELHEIKGIGQKLGDKLLQELGSVKAIRNAELPELEKLIGKSKALLVFNFYKNKNG
jgi:excinuclease ABC subunit C